MAKEIILNLNSNKELQQYFLHYDHSNSEIYGLERTNEIRLKKNEKARYRFVYFLIYCVKQRFKLLFLPSSHFFDVSHWHVFQVYPFFWLLPARKHIISIHDAGFFLLPYTQTFVNKIFMFIIKKSMHKVDKFLVVSQDAKNKLVSYGKFPENKIEIVYPGSNFKSLVSVNPFIRLNVEEPESFIVCVSRWQPHKNVEGLIDGFYKFLSTNPDTDIKLILVGKPVNSHDAPMKKIHYYGLSSKIVILKDLSDSELSWLYDNSVISVFPSIHEGFGLAVLESLSRGCPAIVDSNTSTCEVVGDAGFCVDMKNSTELSATLQMILTDHNQLRTLRGKSKNRADFFSWDKSVSVLLNIYQ